MAHFRLKRGFDLKIAGKAERSLTEMPAPQKVALLPQEFRGIKLRLLIKEGDRVKQGSPLLADKENPHLKLVSPLSGKVSAIRRGERRILQEIIIESDGRNTIEALGPWTTDEITAMSRKDVQNHLLAGGLWPVIIQRPFGKIANPQDVPRDIFISAMDTAPLAADPNFLLQGEEENFQLGLDILRKLTDGKVFLSTDGRGGEIAPAFANARGVEKNSFSGPHPAGNVGVQIHHIKPLKLGELIWQITPCNVALIGKFFKTGVFPSKRIVAVAGSSLKERRYFKTVLGASIANLIPEKNITDKEIRIIMGDVLTGYRTSLNGFLGFYGNLISVIPEGKKERKFLGYFRSGWDMLSVSRSFLSTWIAKKREFVLDTRSNGAVRAFVMSASDYERMMPMDILPVPLAKSIIAKEIEEMEGLGIFELLEEDVALCSFMDLSKTDFGALLREGLDLIEQES